MRGDFIHYPFSLTPLQYSYNALEPVLCSEIIYLHHDKHYGKYVENLNKVLAKYPSLQHLSLEELIVYAEKTESSAKSEILTNAGGVYNHQLYFKCLSCNNTLPKTELLYAIKKDFGSYNNFENSFINKCMSLVGSGYTWLIDNNGRLEIISTANQDTPLSYSVVPLLNIDLWEHSYYLQYKNCRNEYINNWFKIINWAYVEERYKSTW